MPKQRDKGQGARLRVRRGCNEIRRPSPKGTVAKTTRLNERPARQGVSKVPTSNGSDPSPGASRQTILLAVSGSCTEGASAVALEPSVRRADGRLTLTATASPHQERTFNLVVPVDFEIRLAALCQKRSRKRHSRPSACVAAPFARSGWRCSGPHHAKTSASGCLNSTSTKAIGRSAPFMTSCAMPAGR
jgi:hypothetical protein